MGQMYSRSSNHPSQRDRISSRTEGSPPAQAKFRLSNSQVKSDQYIFLSPSQLELMRVLSRLVSVFIPCTAEPAQRYSAGKSSCRLLQNCLSTTPSGSRNTPLQPRVASGAHDKLLRCEWVSDQVDGMIRSLCLVTRCRTHKAACTGTLHMPLLSQGKH